MFFRTFIGLVFCVATVEAGEIDYNTGVVETTSGIGSAWLNAVGSAPVADQGGIVNSFQPEIVGDSLLLRFVSEVTGTVYFSPTQPVLDRQTEPMVISDTFWASELSGVGWTALLESPMEFDFFVGNETTVDFDQVFGQISWQVFPLANADFLLEESGVTFETWLDGDETRFLAEATMTLMYTGEYAVVPEPSMLTFLGLSLLVRFRRRFP